MKILFFFLVVLVLGACATKGPQQFSNDNHPRYFDSMPNQGCPYGQIRNAFGLCTPTIR